MFSISSQLDTHTQAYTDRSDYAAQSTQSTEHRALYLIGKTLEDNSGMAGHCKVVPYFSYE